MVVKSARIPAPGETVLGGEFVMAAGGKGANQAVAAARLGAAVSLVARLGADVFGDQAVAGFQREGIDTSFIARDADAASGVALILVDDQGENVIAVAPGANGRLTKDDVLRAKAVIEGASVLLLQLEVPLETVRCAAQVADTAGVTVILNPAPAQRLDTELLRHVGVLTPNETETELLTGVKVTDENSAWRAARALMAQGVDRVVITMGAAGAYAADGEGGRAITGRKVKAVDTTAAGDAFNGALACALVEGRPLFEAVQFANLAGAFAATRLGAQPSLPTVRELAAFAAEEEGR
jgi:ribokinase